MAGSIIGRADSDVMKMVMDAAKEERTPMSAKLIDLKLNDYLEDLRSDSPAPGGGSVSALAGAQAAGLLMMVADLTTGKEKYRDYEKVCRRAKEDLEPLYEELVQGIDKDTDAYNAVANAFKMPKDTDEQKSARSAAIQEGTVLATKVPLRNMELSLEALKVADAMTGKYNPNCGSDFGVAVLNLRVCLLGAWMNVAINIPGIKDQAVRDGFVEEATRIKFEALELADKIEVEME